MITDELMQQYADLGVKVVGFKAKKHSTKWEDRFGLLICTLLGVEILGVIYLVIQIGRM